MALPLSLCSTNQWLQDHAFTPYGFANDRAIVVRIFRIEDLDTHDLATVDIEDEVQVMKQTAHAGRQIRDIPRPQLIGPTGFVTLGRSGWRGRSVSQAMSLTPGSSVRTDALASAPGRHDLSWLLLSAAAWLFLTFKSCVNCDKYCVIYHEDLRQAEEGARPGAVPA